MSRPKEPKTVALVLQPRLLEQVESFRQKLLKERPGQRVTASDAMRVLIERGLQA